MGERGEPDQRGEEEGTGRDVCLWEFCGYTGNYGMHV